MKLLPSRRGLCTPYNHAPCYFIQSHIHKVHTCLAVTCHLHFWQNDRDLLHAAAVTRGWNGYRNKSQHRKSTLEKKFSRRSSRDSNPRPFNHESGALTTELSPFPAYQQREEKAWLATYCALLHYILSNYLVIRITGTRIVHFICIFRCQCSYIAMVEEW